MIPKKILYTAAHSGFPADVPLGGGATICAQLLEEWRKTRPFDWELLGPGVLGTQAPREKDLVQFSETQYARFCRSFAQEITRRIMRHDPATCVVLSNDVSEGPTFQRLHQRGYRLFTIYHVNVVDYLTAIYLRHTVKTETVARWYTALERSPARFFIPHILQLAFGKQHSSLTCSAGVIVPSQDMKDVLIRSYPDASPDKIHVLPWGLPDRGTHNEVSPSELQSLRDQYQVPEKARILLTLSRISPEKGQDRLLRALQEWEQQPGYPQEGVWVFLCGEAAFMQGKRFRKKLERLAQKLQKTRVLFPGHVTGRQKQTFFRLAELYVFPSRHESYGLTLLEAFAAGLPALVCSQHGSAELMRPEFGTRLPPLKESEMPEAMARALEQLLADPQALQKKGMRAKAFAASQRFSDTAKQLADLLLTSR